MLNYDIYIELLILSTHFLPAVEVPYNNDITWYYKISRLWELIVFIYTV